MAATTQEVSLDMIGDGEALRSFPMPAKGGLKTNRHALVGFDGAGLCQPLLLAGLAAAGVALNTNDSTGVADGNSKILVQRGTFLRAMGGGGDAFAASDFGATAYAIDDQTGGKTSGGGTRPILGIFVGLDADTGLAKFYVNPFALALGNATGAPPIIRSLNLSFGAGSFTAAALTQTWPIGLALPAGARLVSGEASASVVIAGSGPITAAHLQLGVGGDNTLMGALDVFTAPVKANGISASYAGSSAFSAAQLTAKLTAVGGNVSGITAGTLAIDLVFAVD